MIFNNKNTKLCLVLSLLLPMSMLAGVSTFPKIPPSKKIDNTTKVVEENKCSILQKYCKGKKEWKDGRIYVGEFRFGRMHGIGKLTWPDGEEYHGAFYQGLPHGYGKHTYVDGSKFEGEWYEGLREGEGAYRFSCGHEYVGGFADDQMDGEGTILFINGESYSGEWEEGLAHGEGIFKRLDGSVFIGNSTKGQRDGKGLVAWATGDTLQGTWNNGKLDGPSIFTFHNGDQFKTNWTQGKMSTTASYLFEDGEEVTGDMKELEDYINDLIDQDQINNFSNNLCLGHYSIAMEHINSNNLAAADEHLKLAQNIAPFGSDRDQMVAMQMDIVQKRIKEGGWAKVGDNLDN